MRAYLGIAYEYFFKDHPQQFFACLETISEGAQYFGRLSGKALSVVKNITKNAALLQVGYDIPFAFQGFRSVYYKYYNIVTIQGPNSSAPSKAIPLWLEVSNAASSGAALVNFIRFHIFDAHSSSFAKKIRAVAVIVSDGYELYTFYEERKKEAKNFISLDIQTMSFLCQKISALFLTGLSIVSIYQGVDNSAPLLSLFLTTVYLSSHFAYYYKTQSHPERRIVIKQE